MVVYIFICLEVTNTALSSRMHQLNSRANVSMNLILCRDTAIFFFSQNRILNDGKVDFCSQQKKIYKTDKTGKSKALEMSPSLVMSPECSTGTHALQQNNN